MRIRIEVVDNNGNVIWGHEGPVEQPKDLKRPPDRPLVGDRYLFYGFTYQPIVKVKPVDGV